MELDFSQINAGIPQPLAEVYLLHGSDDALKRQALDAIKGAAIDPSSADFDCEECDVPPSGAADADLVRRVISAAAGLPMLSPRRVVILTGVQRLSKEDQDLLASGFTQLADTSCLILISGVPDYDSGKLRAKSVPTAKLMAAAARAGATVLCNAPRGADLRARAAAIVKERGKTIASDALERLLRPAAAAAAERGAGPRGKDMAADFHVVKQELEKVMAYAGARPHIVLADVAAVGASSADDDIFALLDAVGSRNVPLSISLLDEMLRAGDKPDAVAARTFVMLGRHLRLLWGAKFLADERRNPRSDAQGSAEHLLSGELLGLSSRQSFLLRRLEQQGRQWSYPDLRRGIARILASDMAMKGIAIPAVLGVRAPGLDPASNLRLLVVELCGTR